MLSKRIMSGIVLLVILASALNLTFAAPQRQELPATMPNGVASGDVTQTSVVLWTHSTELGTVLFEYSTSEDFAEIAGSAEAEVTDALQPVKVLVEGLTPGTQYYYRATDAAGNSVSGMFQTPFEAGEKHGLRFGVTGDWRGELAPYPAVLNALERDLDFFVLHGDTIYSDYPSPDVDLLQALTLEDYRRKHNEVYSTRHGLNAFGQLRGAVPIFAMIDDHEVTNDFAGGAAPAYDPRFADYEGTYVNDTELYNNGLQAFSEYNPIVDETYGDTGDPLTANKRKLYRYRTFGDDAAFFLLDARSFRSEPLPPVTDVTDTAAIIGFLNDSFDAERTMLGRPQMELLKADLLAADAAGVTWKFIMVPEPVQNFGILYAQDRFEGYAAERTEILIFIGENDIKNVVFVAADFHGTVVNNLTYQDGLRDLLGERHNRTNTFEVVTSSVAFSEPFGPTVVRLALAAGFITQEQHDNYFTLTPAEQDAFTKLLINGQVEPFGYTLVGLEDAPEINAELITGDYLATNFFGWTEFEIDAETQALRVINYGIEPYTPEEIATDHAEIITRTPVVISEFVVTPQE